MSTIEEFQKETWPDDGPGRWVCRDCGSKELTFSGTGAWNEKTQQMDFEEDCEKPFCQQCECRGWAKFVLFADMPEDTRGAPRLCRDFYDNLYVIVDDTGEPFGPYHLTLDAAKAYRDGGGAGGPAQSEVEYYRIARLVYRALPNEDEPDEIVDDPRAPPAAVTEAA